MARRKKDLDHNVADKVGGPVVLMLMLLVGSTLMPIDAWAVHTLSVSNVSGREIQALLGFFPNDCGTYTLEWGDATPNDVFLFLPPSGTTTRSHTYAADGTYTVTLQACGGQPAVSDSIAVPLDATPPIVAITTPAVNPSTTTSPLPVTVSGTATDAESGITGVTWFNANIPDGGSASGTTSWSHNVPIAAGTNHIVITATNGSGLQGSDSIDVIYTPADAVDPVVTIGFPATDPYSTNSSSITVTGSATDNVGVTSVIWYNSTTEMGDTAAGTTAWSAGPISLNAGTNDILITAYDAAGNSGTDSVRVVYTSLDTQNPVVTIVSPTGSDTYSTRTSPVPLSGTASDDVGVTGVVWANDRGGGGAAAGTAGWSIAAVTLQPGVNVVTVTASDASAKTGNDILTVTYDSGAPTVQITGPTSATAYTTNASPLTLSGTASDNETSVDTVVWANSASGGNGAAAGTSSWTASGITLVPGTNAITVTAADQLGNQSADIITVTYDNTDPTVAISSPTAAATYQTTASSIALAGTASDTITTVAEVRWVNDRGGSGTASGTTSWSIPSVTLSTGTNIITITTEDEAGNTSTDILTVTFDNVDPVVTITSPTSSATYATGSAMIPLGGTASDTGSTVTNVTWVNDRGGSGAASGTTSWSVASVNLFGGVNVITVTAVDELGNTGIDILTVTYTPADVIDPTITITTPTSAPAYTANSTPISLGGTASDNTGVTQVLWANDRGGSGSAAGTAVWSIPAVNLSLGTNVLTVTAWDVANNTADDTLTIDYSPPDLADPTVTIIVPAADPYYTNTGSLVLSGTANDDISLVEVRWVNDRGGSGTATGTDSWNATVTGLAEGDNNITVTAEDWTGKTGTDTVTIVYDPTAPTVTISSPTTEATYDTESTTVAISGTAADNLGVVEVLWSNDRGGSGAAAGTASWTVSGITLAEGQNVITVTASDEVGNTGVDVLTVNPTEFLGPSFAGPFFVGRMELQFTVDDPKTPGVVYSAASPGQATVPRNYQGFGANAIITYSASGILQGKWLVDGQVLGTVSQMLYPGRSEAVVPFPDVPGLPTYDAGIHRVELQIDSPSPAFDEPSISYFVTAEEAPEVLPPLTLLYPDDNGSAPLVPGTLQSPNFRWQGPGLGYTYRIVLEGRSRSAAVRTYQGGIPPVVIAETPFTRYNLSIFDIGRLFSGSPYTWTVTALRNGRPEARGGPRTITFTLPLPVQEGVSIRDLTVSGEGGQQLQIMDQPDGEVPEGLIPMVKYLAVEPQPLVIAGMIRNESGEDARNLRVEFTADGEVVDVAFISYLPAGTQEQVTGLYDLQDQGTHVVLIQVTDQGGQDIATMSVQVGSGTEAETITTESIHLIGLRPEGNTVAAEPIHLIGLRPQQATITTEPIHLIGLRPEETTVTVEPIHLIGLRPGQATITTEPIHLIGLRPEGTTVSVEPIHLIGLRPEQATITTEPIHLIGLRPEQVTIQTEPIHLIGLRPEPKSVNTPGIHMTGIGEDQKVVNTPDIHMTGIGEDQKVVNTPDIHMTGIGQDQKVVNTPDIHMTGIGQDRINVNTPPIHMIGIE